MKKTVRRKSRSLAALSLVSAVSVPAASISAYADETAVVKEVNEIPETKENDGDVPAIIESVATNSRTRGEITPIKNDKLEKALEAAAKKVSPDLSSRKISTWGTETLKRIVDEQPIKAGDINNLVKYAAGKGMSLVDFLKSVGFNTDNLPSSVLMPTGDV